MFRTGGTAEGITSGLAPRQGYAHKPGHVKQDDWQSKTLGDIYSGKTTLGELQNISDAMQYKPRGTNIYDFMTEMGLDLVSRPKAGNIFQQLATSAKEPYQRFMERKQSAAEQEYGSQSSMFKTLLQAGAAATGDKSYAHRDKAAMIRENMDKQFGVYDQLAALDKEAPDYTNQREDLLKSLRKLKKEVSGDEFAKHN